MRFMVIRKADKDTEQGIMPSDQLISDMAKFNEKLLHAGVLVDGQGLHPSAQGARISFTDGDPSVVYGPFEETEALVAGYTIIQVKDREEALAWMRQWPSRDANGNARLELRRMFELEDFEPGEGIKHTEEVFGQLHNQATGSCTYLNFNGNCREAFGFYERLLGGKIQMMASFADMPAMPETNAGCGAAGVQADDKDKIMHACLSFGGGMLMGSDAPTGRYLAPQGFFVQLQIDGLPQAQAVFDALAEGGQVQMPFAETFWAEGFGMLVDAYGIPWMVNSNYKL
ncbi:YciI family protein [Shewanella sp. AS16]|uniref:YciI family protein n=1 Tax=Shewanella sp. AS16 TaxID=2907625 RepID=UPI001F3ECF1E|nr:YciI family protein [Shewanella sp. AS16]MCE9686341.1 YciI family protein [Shewanella sp. AS16]